MKNDLMKNDLLKLTLNCFMNHTIIEKPFEEELKMEYNTLLELVKNVLAVNAETRSDDFKLWLKVSNQIYDDFGLNPTPGQTDFYLKDVHDVLSHAKEWGLPAFESVTRARRKIQELHPGLCDEKTKAARMERYEKTRAYFNKQAELAERYKAGDPGVCYSSTTMNYSEMGDYVYSNDEV